MLPNDEEKFRKMLERHGKAFTFIPEEIKSKSGGTNGYFYNIVHPLESKTNFCSKSKDPANDRDSESENKNGHLGALTLLTQADSSQSRRWMGNSDLSKTCNQYIKSPSGTLVWDP